MDKFFTFIKKLYLKIKNGGFADWLLHRLNIRRAIVLVVLLNMAAIVSHHWFDWSLNAALCLVGFFDYKGYLDDKK